MLLPSIFERDFMDPFDEWEQKYVGRRTSDLMKTDVKELENAFIVEIDLPGFDKSDIRIELEDGSLTVSASKEEKKEEKDKKNGRYIRRERYVGACKRTFYVGDQVTEEDIKASFEKGVLSIEIPKKEVIPEKPEKKVIAISGGEQ